MKKALIALVLVLTTGFAFSVANEPEQSPLTDSTSSDKLFITDKVWEIHLGFTAESWDAMDPQTLRGRV
jgi:hypothetical protein